MFLLVASNFVWVRADSTKSSQEVVKLPVPQREGGMPLMQALNERKTSRTFSDKELPIQTLSDLLWAAYGINRTDSGNRTAPSAYNVQETDIYVAMLNGLYLYQPQEHILQLVLAQDVRELCGRQDFVKEAPVNLIYVADYSKMDKVGDEQDFYSAADCGFISQNVYLYCASEGLATVIRGLVDRETLAKTMNLRSEQKIILVQTVGFKKKPSN